MEQREFSNSYSVVGDDHNRSLVARQVGDRVDRRTGPAAFGHRLSGGGDDSLAGQLRLIGGCFMLGSVEQDEFVTRSTIAIVTTLRLDGSPSSSRVSFARRGDHLFI